MRKRIFMLCTVFLIGIVMHAQSKRNIYISHDVATKFTSGMMERDIAGDYSFFRFLGYQTTRHTLITDSDFEKVNRDGLLLPAKSTFTYSITANADFGSEADSCTIDYSTVIEKVRNGRSAALSILNIFSKDESRVRQPAPYITINSTCSQGSIYHNRDTASFTYKMVYHGRMIPQGLLTLNGEKLHCEPVSYQYKRKGKLRKANYYFLTGFLLMKNDIIYAALDQSNQQDTIYLCNQLTDEEKLIIAAYLFIIACYQ